MLGRTRFDAVIVGGKIRGFAGMLSRTASCYNRSRLSDFKSAVHIVLMYKIVYEICIV
jgi:hypothetical protein